MQEIGSRSWTNFLHRVHKALEKAKDTTLDALSRITLIHRVALVPVLLYFNGNCIVSK